MYDVVRREPYGRKTDMGQLSIQYVTDENGNTTSVIVPIELWREIESERETAYLLKSETMKKRLLEARRRTSVSPNTPSHARTGVHHEVQPD